MDYLKRPEERNTVIIKSASFHVLNPHGAFPLKHASKDDVKEYVGNLSIAFLENLTNKVFRYSSTDHILDKEELTLDYNAGFVFWCALQMNHSKGKALESASIFLLHNKRLL